MFAHSAAARSTPPQLDPTMMMMKAYRHIAPEFHFQLKQDESISISISIYRSRRSLVALCHSRFSMAPILDPVYSCAEFGESTSPPDCGQFPHVPQSCLPHPRITAKHADPLQPTYHPGSLTTPNRYLTNSTLSGSMACFSWFVCTFGPALPVTGSN